MTPVMKPFLAEATFWVAAVACVVAQAAIVRSVLVARAPQLPPEARIVLPRRGVELLWTLVPAIALLVVLALTWGALPSAADAPPTADGSAVGAEV